MLSREIISNSVEQLQNTQYSYDNRGNRIGVTGTGFNEYTENYTYDLNNRLTNLTKVVYNEVNSEKIIIDNDIDFNNSDINNEIAVNEPYNPFRYCGEYYDEETGLIYLRARYYDPAIGRFISEDTHWNPSNMIYGDKEYKNGEKKSPDVTAIMQSCNLFAYCMNDPMNFVDPSGDNAAAILSGSWGIGGSVAAFDGLLPYGDAVGLVIGVGGSVIAGGVWIYNSITTYFAEAKSKAINDAITKIKTENPNDTIIYRTGSGNATNLTPRDVDITGLSYSTIMPTNGSFTITTIGTINSTGTLKAIQDGITHVSVSPIDSSKMKDWIDSRPFALVNPHEYTKILQSISVKIR